MFNQNVEPNCLGLASRISRPTSRVLAGSVLPELGSPSPYPSPPREGTPIFHAGKGGEHFKAVAWFSLSSGGEGVHAESAFEP